MSTTLPKRCSSLWSSLWHNCAYPLYPADSTPILISNTISDCGLIRCYSPYLNKMFILRTPLRAPESRIFSVAVDGRVILRRPDKTALFGSLLDGSAFETTESKYDEGYFWTSNEDGTEHPEQCDILGFYPSTHRGRVQSWNGKRWKYFGYSDEDDSSSDSYSDSDSDSGSGSGSGYDSDSDLDSDSDSDSYWDDDEDADEEGKDEEMEMEIEKEYSDSNSDSSDNSEEDADKEGEEVEPEEETEDADEMVEQEGNLRLFTMSCSSPVLHKGLWYFLGGGSLGVYDPKTIDWSVLGRPTSFGSEFPHKNCYLVESCQELLAVLTGRDGTPIHVLKLNEEEMMWERMDSLDSRAIFTGTMASLSMAKPPKAMANKVYLPKFYGHPQIIPAKLITCRGQFFFVPERKEMQQPSSNKPVYNFMREQDTCGDKDGAWCYDMQLDSGVDKEIVGCKNMLQYIWVHLGRASR